MSFELTTLGAFAKVQGGYAYKSSDFLDEGACPVLKIKNIRAGHVDYDGVSYVADHVAEATSKWQTEAGDILISMTGSGPSAPDSLVGRVAKVWRTDPKALINQRVGRVRLKDNARIDLDFLFYLLSWSETQQYLVSNSTGSANQVNISGATIESVECPNIDYETSKAISSLLGALDERVRLLRETNVTLEAIAQALFKSWFVDFDPVRAKAEGRQPEGMDAATAALFPDSFDESEQGLVPKGWKLVPFGELLIHSIGGDWGDEVPGEKNDTRVAIIRGTDIPDLQSGTANRVPVRYTSSKKLSTRKLKNGDLVLEISGGSKGQPTGRALYITDLLLGQFDCPVEPASFCRLLRPASVEVGVLLGQQLSYIYSIGKTWEYQNQSTGIANFQTTHFLESELVALPPPDVLAEFSAIVRPLIDRTHQSQVRDLTQLRDTLLPRLISGQLRLPEAMADITESTALELQHAN